MGLFSKLPIIGRLAAEVPPGIKEMSIIKKEAVLLLKMPSQNKKEIQRHITSISAKLQQIEEHMSRYKRHKDALSVAGISRVKVAKLKSSVQWFEAMYGSIGLIQKEHDSLLFLKSKLIQALGPLK